MTRTWVEDLTDAVAAHVEDDAEAGTCWPGYADAFPEAYKEDFDGEAAYLDLAAAGRAARLGDAAARPHVYRDGG